MYFLASATIQAVARGRQGFKSVKSPLRFTTEDRTMCCFSSPPRRVASTSILSRVDGDRQFIAYEMQFSASEELAMILPIPVVPGCPEDSINFISLEDYKTLFSDLHSWFNPRPKGRGRAKSGRANRAAPRLVVHSVGVFEASFVPSIGDFTRLDPRFRIDAQIWNTWPQYGDYGFAVFKLKAGDDQQVHPMAFSFITRDPSQAFFPTLHIHGDEAISHEFFDHDLYLQLPDAPSEVPPPPFTGEEIVKAELEKKAARAEASVDLDRMLESLKLPPPPTIVGPTTAPPPTTPPPPLSPATPPVPSPLSNRVQSVADRASDFFSPGPSGPIPDVRIPGETTTVDPLEYAVTHAPKWRGGTPPQTYKVDCSKTAGVMAQSWPTYTIGIVGTHPNRDIWVPFAPAPVQTTG